MSRNEKRPLDSGRKDVLGRTVRVGDGVTVGRADAPPPPQAAAGVPRVVKVVDTRDRVEMDDRWVALSGTGDGHVCDRCGRMHEVHALVDTGDGRSVTVGTGCALKVLAGAGVDEGVLEGVERQVGRVVRAAKALTKARLEVAELEERQAVWDGMVDAAAAGAPGVDRVVEIPATVTAERSDGRYVTLELVADGLRVEQNGFVSDGDAGRLDEFRSQCAESWVRARARGLLAVRQGADEDADLFRVAYPFERAGLELDAAGGRVEKAELRYRQLSDDLDDDGAG